MSGISSVGGMLQGMTRSFAPPSFSSLDANSDGGLTVDELTSSTLGGVSDAQSQSRAAELFSKMDGDGDGTVTSAEKDTFDSELQQRVSDMQFSTQLIASGGGLAGAGASEAPDIGSLASSILSALDSDADASVSLEEFSSSEAVSDYSTDEVEALFNALDADGSGSVSEDELASFLEDNKPEGATMGAGPPSGPPPGSGTGEAGSSAQAGGSAGAGGGSSSTETYDVLDTNEDGTVSLEERLAGYSSSVSDSEDDDETAAVLNMLSAALSAYSTSSSSSSGDYWSSILGTLDLAA